MAVSSSDDPICRMRNHSVSRRNLATIVEAIRHLEGDRFYCDGGAEESFEGSQSGDSDGDDASVTRATSSLMCDNSIGQFTHLSDTPKDCPFAVAVHALCRCTKTAERDWWRLFALCVIFTECVALSQSELELSFWVGDLGDHNSLGTDCQTYDSACQNFGSWIVPSVILAGCPEGRKP